MTTWEFAEVFNEYFANITDELDLTENEANLSFSENIEEPMNKPIQKHKNHLSIKEIKHQWAPQQLFELREIGTKDVSKHFQRLKSKNPH